MALITGARVAEAVARDWMRSHGFPDAQLTGKGRDGGVDVRATGAVAQVKFEGKPIGAPVVQMLHGVAAYEKRQALVFSLTGYTRAALDWAELAGVALLRFDAQSNVEAVNALARHIEATPRAPQPGATLSTPSPRGQPRALEESRTAPPEPVQRVTPAMAARGWPVPGETKQQAEQRERARLERSARRERADQASKQRYELRKQQETERREWEKHGVPAGQAQALQDLAATRPRPEREWLTWLYLGVADGADESELTLDRPERTHRALDELRDAGLIVGEHGRWRTPTPAEWKMHSDRVQAVEGAASTTTPSVPRSTSRFIHQLQSWRDRRRK